MAKNGYVQNFRNVSHIIFDMDGLLLDTETLYTLATQKILEPFGHEYTFEVKLELMGLQHQQMSERIVELYNLPMKWQDYSKQQRDILLELMGNAKLMPDTEPIYEEITRRIASSFGKPYPLEVRMKIMGTTEQHSAEIAVKELKLPMTIDEYFQKHSELSKQFLGGANLCKGAERLLRHLKIKNIPFALATSSGEDMVHLKTTNHRELFNSFHHRVCGSTDPEVKNGKPAPDIFLVAAGRFSDKPLPQNCLVFEDSPNGVTAAIQAGMQCVMVPDSRVPDELRSHATQVLSSLEEFKPEDFGLAPFDS